MENIGIHTPEEIMARIAEAQKRDPFGFEWHEYVIVLDYETLKPLLKPDANPEDVKPISLKDLDERAKGYLDFWLEKIEGERGISVCRATQHYTAWKWLLGHPDADTFPGSINGGEGGWYQRDAYAYIKQQIDSGEWDSLSRFGEAAP
jgi:hypothetical protein